jgi:hypothetical protein
MSTPIHQELFSDQLCNSIKDKAAAINIQYDFLFSAIFTIACAKLDKKNFTDKSITEDIYLDYYRMHGMIQEKLSPEDSKEISNEHYRLISHSPNLGNALSYMSMTEPIKINHVKALNTVVDYVKHLREIQYPNNSVSEIIIFICPYEITKAYFEIQEIKKTLQE